ncbi:hypothetical protein Ddye_000662 [Dipteronia dyeriana]|uniref:Uncharacterized protein n=1 Tax=Dipteronia dyeriana TaxID=168575 RepID=A0AAD9XMQ9_9ROSI|nr:hypothetical protein Ddye_000662 [Dipteronia dyeriana]
MPTPNLSSGMQRLQNFYYKSLNHVPTFVYLVHVFRYWQWGVSNNVTSSIRAHTAEVCGLRWSNEGNLLASGGNENLICIWEPSKMISSNYLHRFNDHPAAVKALAWCPHQFNVLASGGGTKDGCIKIWNAKKGKLSPQCRYQSTGKQNISFLFLYVD